MSLFKHKGTRRLDKPMKKLRKTKSNFLLLDSDPHKKRAKAKKPLTKHKPYARVKNISNKKKGHDMENIKAVKNTLSVASQAILAYVCVETVFEATGATKVVLACALIWTVGNLAVWTYEMVIKPVSIAIINNQK